MSQLPILSFEHEGYKCDVYQNFYFEFNEQYLLYVEDEVMAHFNHLADGADYEEEKQLAYKKAIEFFQDADALIDKINNYIWQQDFGATSYGLAICVFTQDIILSKVLGKYFQDIIDSHEYEFMDNFRVSQADDKDSERLYLKRKSEGCCGSYDEEVEIMGKTYKMGFNFGH